MLDQLAEKFSQLSISDPTQTQEVSKNQDPHLDMIDPSMLKIPFEVQAEEPSSFQLGLKNTSLIYQDTINHLMQSQQEIPFIGAQKGLVLSIMPKGGIVH